MWEAWCIYFGALDDEVVPMFDWGVSFPFWAFLGPMGGTMGSSREDPWAVGSRFGDEFWAHVEGFIGIASFNPSCVWLVARSLFVSSFGSKAGQL